jgi:tight adherence protein C
MILIIISMILFFLAIFIPIYFYLLNKKPSAETKKESLVEKIKRTVSIHKQFMKINYINARVTKLWIRMGKPSYPLPEDMIVIKQIAAFVTFIVFWLLGVGIFTALILGIAAFFVPDMSFNQTAKTRLKEIERALPEAIDILTLCIEAGMDFMAALYKIIENSEPSALRDEFQEVVRELQLGSTRKDALLNFAKRCDIEDIISFVSVIVQSEELGTSLVDVLRGYAQEMRIKRWNKAEKLALEAPTKMLFPMIIFIFPGVFVLIFGPVAIQLLKMF